MITTSTIKVTINVPFSEWVMEFDSELTQERHLEFGIKPLFRGVSQADPTQVLIVHQHPDGAAEKFMAKYADWISSHGVMLETAEVSEWSADGEPRKH